MAAQEDVKASQQNVTEQTKLMNSAGTAWHAVKVGNLERITHLFPAVEDVYQQGPVGENVFHIAMLLNTPTSLAIARYLIRLYGETLVNAPYQERTSAADPPGLYEGETAIHIAIVNRDLDLVRFLVNNGADVRARAYGAFFDASGPCYYGEYPLSFAAATGQQDIVSYLRRHGARPDIDADLKGNTALHMCVWHTQPEMYAHLLELGALEHLPNNDGMSCLLLAARRGNRRMFEYIVSRMHSVVWAYGPVTSYIICMREIDTVQGRKANHKLRQSALATIVRKRHRQLVHVPLVRDLFRLKWLRFGRTMFALDAAAHAAAAALLLALCALRLRALQTSPAYSALSYVLLGLVAALVLFAAADVYWSLQQHLQLQQIRHASPHYVPPLYPIPSMQATQDAFLRQSEDVARSSMDQSPHAVGEGEARRGPASVAYSVGRASTVRGSHDTVRSVVSSACAAKGWFGGVPPAEAPCCEPCGAPPVASPISDAHDGGTPPRGCAAADEAAAHADASCAPASAGAHSAAQGAAARGAGAGGTFVLALGDANRRRSARRAAPAARSSMQGGVESDIEARWSRFASSERSNSALSAVHAARMLRASWVAERPSGAGAASRRAAQEVGASASGGTEQNASVAVPVGEGAEGDMLAQYADEVWDSVVRQNTYPRFTGGSSASRSHIPNYNPSDFATQQESDVPHDAFHTTLGGDDDSVEEPGKPGEVSLFDELVRTYGRKETGNSMVRKASFSSELVRKKSTLGLNDTAATVPNVVSQVTMTVGQRVSISARYLLSLMLDRKDILADLLAVWYLFTLVTLICWAYLAGQPDQELSARREAVMDSLVAASTFLAFLALPFFARGWQPTGTAAVVATMLARQLFLIALPFGAALCATAAAMAVVVMGPGKGDQVAALYPGATSARLAWAAFRVSRAEGIDTPATAALHAALADGLPFLAPWEVAVLWLLYCAVIATAALFAVTAVALTVHTCAAKLDEARDTWKMQFYTLIVQYEYRLLEGTRQRHRIGAKGYSGQWRRQAYSHQYEQMSGSVQQDDDSKEE